MKIINALHFNIFDINEALKIFDHNDRALICFNEIEDESNLYVFKSDKKYHVHVVEVSSLITTDGWEFDTLLDIYKLIQSEFNYESIKI